MSEVYVHLKKGKVAKTAQLKDHNVIIDYDKDDEVIGVEVLGAYRIDVDGEELK